MKSCFIIAEISANHLQKIDTAIALIKAAKDAGADAVKFQAYTPDTITLNIDNRYFRIRSGKWKGQTLYELYKKAYTPWGWFNKLKKIADDLGIVFFCTSFDKSAVDLLEAIDVPMHKIASFELVDLPLIEYAAKTKKPLIMSTGMASAAEIREAIKTARTAGAKNITLLKCVSCYPARPEEMNLAAIPLMKKLFGVPVGISDHSLGIGVSIAAVPFGAVIIEKHFTLSRKIKTVDSFFSLEPAELKELVRNVRITEKAIGKASFRLTEDEKRNKVFRRSLFAVEGIARGDIFTDDNIRSIRPAYGLKPKYLKSIFGKKAKRDIEKGSPLKWDMIG